MIVVITFAIVLLLTLASVLSYFGYIPAKVYNRTTVYSLLIMLITLFIYLPLN